MQAIIFVFCTIWIAFTSTKENLCSQSKVTNKMPASIAGRWFLVAAKNRETYSETMANKKFTCGGNNNALPCSCSGLDVKGPSSEAHESYNITNFSYDMTSEKYNYIHYMMKPVDNGSEARFNLFQNGGDKHILKGLASNDERTFMFVLLCSAEDEDEDLWFWSRTPEAADNSMKEVNKVLDDNNLSINQLFMVEQSGCVYPPMAGAVTSKDRML